MTIQELEERILYYELIATESPYEDMKQQAAMQLAELKAEREVLLAQEPSGR